MWHIQSATYGEDAYPRYSIGMGGVDRSRFAKYVLYNAQNDIRLALRLYLPKDAASCNKAIFSVHGIKRNANKYRNIFVPHVQDKNVLIVSPSFTDDFYNDSLALKMGNMCRGVKNPKFLPKDEWTFTHLYEVFLLLQKEIPLLRSFSLFGHSAGAQFAHRMLLFTEYPEMERAVAANAGWYTVLDSNLPFPYGIGVRADSQQIKRILEKKLVLVVGDKDIAQDSSLRLTKKTIRQGQNRLERAQYAFEVARSKAEELQVACNWQLVNLPNVAHSSRSIVPLVLEYLL